MSRGHSEQPAPFPLQQPDPHQADRPEAARLPWIVLMLERVQGDRLMFGVAECSKQEPPDHPNTVLHAAAAREVVDGEGLAHFTLYVARLLGHLRRAAESQGFTAPDELAPAGKALTVWACRISLEWQGAPGVRSGDPASPV